MLDFGRLFEMHVSVLLHRLETEHTASGESAMSKRKVLIEVEASTYHGGFEQFEEATHSEAQAYSQSAAALEPTAGLGVEPDDTLGPIPMFGEPSASGVQPMDALGTIASTGQKLDLQPSTLVVPAEIDYAKIDELNMRTGVVAVWENSRVHLFDSELSGRVNEAPFDLARSRPGVDCRPFRPPVDMSTIRELLGVNGPWQEGFRGQNVTVAILDDGVDGTVYPVGGGFAPPESGHQPGTARTSSHGSMCAADVLVAAPAARLYDYPFLGVPRSGGALRMFTEILDQRRRDGTPHIATNSWGHYSAPPEKDFPTHEVWNVDHAIHRKIKECIAAGVVTFFAAGNCGANCPSPACQASAISPNISILASNSLEEVITVGAVNSRHERLGYSSQGPGKFFEQKPDLVSYTHFLGNFGDGRPGGTDQQQYDNGTSAATPVAAGVAALLMSAIADLSPADVRTALLEGLIKTSNAEWERDYGRGIVNAAASYTHLVRKM
ncbi:S8 family serine peptidase [Streptomyces sp. NPDC048710]|uniref:S8 family peptidase n=1 Tax=Streptomyces sp. NPDC048710 TaxID=3365586 RepID=UPI00371396D9